MEEFDRLVISLLDSEAIKGCFKKELAEKLNISVKNITGVWLETDLVDGVATQTLVVAFVNVKISKERLMKLPFKSIYENTIRFEVGDILL